MSEYSYRLAPAARRDFASLTDHLLAVAGPEIAGRFVDQTRTTFAAIAQAPVLGSPIPTRSVRLFGLRKRKVTEFGSFLVFYQTTRRAFVFFASCKRREIGRPCSMRTRT